MRGWWSSYVDGKRTRRRPPSWPRSPRAGPPEAGTLAAESRPPYRGAPSGRSRDRRAALGRSSLPRQDSPRPRSAGNRYVVFVRMLPWAEQRVESLFRAAGARPGCSTVDSRETTPTLLARMRKLANHSCNHFGFVFVSKTRAGQWEIARVHNSANLMGKAKMSHAIAVTATGVVLVFGLLTGCATRPSPTMY